jgi:uncharacterized protein (DUF1697 family)
MLTYIALVRGLGGKYIVPMKDLVRLMQRLGLRDVRTYIQSGNAVFRSKRIDVIAVAEKIKAAIQRGYGFAPEVVIVTFAELSKAIAANPYPEAAADHKSVHLYFMAAAPKTPDLDALDALRANGERFVLKGKVFYLHAPAGVGKSKLFARIEKKLGVPATARNWRTVCQLKELAEELRS